MSKAPDPLARILLEKAELVEAERQRKIMERRAEEQRRRILHEQAVEEAMGELEAYARLIKEAKAYLGECRVDTELLILKELRDQVDSDPRYVAHEARVYRKLLRRDLEEAKQKALQKRREAWLKQQEIVAVIAVMTRSFQLQKALNEISLQFHELRMKSMDNPEVERTICDGLKVKNLIEAEEYIKKVCVEAFREQLRQELKDNPFFWYVEFLTA